ALRQATGPALSLATFGVVLTTAIFGAAAYYLINLSWLESSLLGAAVASTDAAAVFFRASVLAELKRIAQRFGTLFIADEVMTGWGRTGTMFACEQASVSPDI
ncbi:aminotransferase class III-fold pyridoxal phosphate-dependent enzyme, partial [bacterium M00.F.Ca.ET.168.01.1.1]